MSNRFTRTELEQLEWAKALPPIVVAEAALQFAGEGKISESQGVEIAEAAREIRHKSASAAQSDQ